MSQKTFWYALLPIATKGASSRNAPGNWLIMLPR